MKLFSSLALLAFVPLLILAKCIDAANVSPESTRFLKKAKASKTPKKKFPKTTPSPTTPSPTDAPSDVPTVTPRLQAFYSNQDTILTLQKRVIDGNTYTLDLGTVKDLFGKDTMAVVQTSFTTVIEFGDYYSSESWMSAIVYLQILAYDGCDSAETCQGVIPTPLIPEEVEMYGWQRYSRYIGGIGIPCCEPDEYCSPPTLPICSSYSNNEVNYDAFGSTNDANFILVGKGTGDIFLQASITIDFDLSTDADLIDRTNNIDVIVKNWVVIVQHGETNMRVTNFDLPHTASPTPGKNLLEQYNY